MRVLVVGSGGREHALAWAIAASPLVDKVYCAPGNAGIAEDAECVPVAASDTGGLIAFCRKAAIDFVVVGPEAPLVGGLVDARQQALRRDWPGFGVTHRHEQSLADAFYRYRVRHGAKSNRAGL